MTSTEAEIQKSSNEAACRLLGHMPVPKTNQTERGIVTQVVCECCGTKL